MDKARYDKGVEMRTRVLGEEYVNKALQGASDFSREFQELLTEYCWGTVWGSETLSPKQRSLLNLSMLAALGRSHEFELHFRGALRNGCSREELKDTLIQIAVYCGIPAGVESFRIARRVLDELDANGS